MRVLVTRPLADAARTAARLASLGHEAVVAPVLAVGPTGVPRPEGPFDALLLTSANAVPFLSPADRHLPLLAVGQRTAGVAQEAGFTVAGTAGGDAAALAHLVGERCPPAARLLHPSGEIRKAEPGRSLTRAGFGYVPWAVYAARPVDRLPDAAAQALRAGSIGAVVHYSRRSAEVLLALAEQAGLTPALVAAVHLCLSEDVAVPVRRAAPRRIAVAASPDESALLDELAALASPLPREG